MGFPGTHKSVSICNSPFPDGIPEVGNRKLEEQSTPNQPDNLHVVWFLTSNVHRIVQIVNDGLKWSLALSGMINIRIE